MERKEFLTKLGFSIAATCIGCSMIACGSDPDEEAVPEPGGGGNGELLSADLNTELRNTGDFKAASGVIVVRLAAANVPASFTAVQQACTHQGVAISYNNAQRKFVCPAHGSQFDAAGAVLQGPATAALKKYTITINGGTLTVSG